jgi:hypothetical protein
MRGYTVATSAFTLEVPIKWLDNVLTHHQVPGVQQSRQGVMRLLAPSALLQLEIALILHRTLAIPLTVAIPLALELKQAGGEIISGSPALAISLDLSKLTSDLNRRLADAIEIAPTPLRGRPPSK